MKHLPIQDRANSFILYMRYRNEKFTIADIARVQYISKPMARRVFMKMATMAVLVIELHPYRSNTSEIKFSLMQNANMTDDMYRSNSRVMDNAIIRFLSDAR